MFNTQKLKISIEMTAITPILVVFAIVSVPANQKIKLRKNRKDHH